MLRTSFMKKHDPLCNQLKIKSLENPDALATIAKWLQEKSKFSLQPSTFISEEDFERSIHIIDDCMMELITQFPSKHQITLAEILNIIRNEFPLDIQTPSKIPTLSEEKIAPPLSPIKKLEEKLNNQKRNFSILHAPHTYRPNSTEDKRKILKLEMLIKEKQALLDDHPDVEDPSYKKIERTICDYEDLLFRLLDAADIEAMEQKVKAETELKQYKPPITPIKTDITEISAETRRAHSMFRSATSITLERLPSLSPHKSPAEEVTDAYAFTPPSP